MGVIGWTAAVIAAAAGVLFVAGMRAWHCPDGCCPHPEAG